jgi:hypothetical protein
MTEIPPNRFARLNIGKSRLPFFLVSRREWAYVESGVLSVRTRGHQGNPRDIRVLDLQRLSISNEARVQKLPDVAPA